MEWATRLICSIAVVALVMGLRRARLRRRGGISEYDERQKQVRGKGAGYAFYAVLFYNALYALVCVIAEREFMEPALAGFLAVYVGMVVIGLYSVRHDAFFPPRYPWRPYLGLCLAITVISALVTVNRARNGGFILNGRLTLACLLPAMALVFLMLSVAIVLQQCREQEDEP